MAQQTTRPSKNSSSGSTKRSTSGRSRNGNGVQRPLLGAVAHDPGEPVLGKYAEADRDRPQAHHAS